MQGVKAAARYAKSLIELAVEQKLLDTIFADMKLVNNTCKASRELLLMLRSPIIKTDKKQAVLKSVFSAQVNNMTISFISLITDKKREMYLPEIADSFVSQYKQIKGIKTAEITTVAPLDEKLRQEVLQIVKKYTNSEVELNEKVNSELIGGYILTLEGEQDDTSIKTKINKLKRAFKENLYVKDY